MHLHYSLYWQMQVMNFCFTTILLRHPFLFQSKAKNNLRQVWKFLFLQIANILLFPFPIFDMLLKMCIKISYWNVPMANAKKTVK